MVSFFGLVLSIEESFIVITSALNSEETAQVQHIEFRLVESQLDKESFEVLHIFWIRT